MYTKRKAAWHKTELFNNAEKAALEYFMSNEYQEKENEKLNSIAEIKNKLVGF